MGFASYFIHEISRTDSKGNTIDISPEDEEETNYDVDGADPEEPQEDPPDLDGETNYDTDGADPEDTDLEDPEGGGEDSDEAVEEPDLDGDTNYDTDGADPEDTDLGGEDDGAEGEEPDLDGDTNYDTDGADPEGDDLGGEDGAEGDPEGGDDLGDNGDPNNLGSAEEPAPEGEEQDPDQRIKDLQKQVSKLSEDQLKIRDKTLITNFIELFNLCGSINKRLNDISRTPDTEHDIQFAIDKTQILRKTIFAYITDTYRTKTYIENSNMYSECLMVINIINNILKKNIKPKKKDK